MMEILRSQNKNDDFSLTECVPIRRFLNLIFSVYVGLHLNSQIVPYSFSFCVYALYNIPRKKYVHYFYLFIFGIRIQPRLLVCGIICNKDNWGRGSAYLSSEPQASHMHA